MGDLLLPHHLSETMFSVYCGSTFASGGIGFHRALDISLLSKVISTVPGANHFGWRRILRVNSVHHLMI